MQTSILFVRHTEDEKAEGGQHDTQEVQESNPVEARIIEVLEALAKTLGIEFHVVKTSAEISQQITSGPIKQHIAMWTSPLIRDIQGFDGVQCHIEEQDPEKVKEAVWRLLSI